MHIKATELAPIAAPEPIESSEEEMFPGEMTDCSRCKSYDQNGGQCSGWTQTDFCQGMTSTEEVPPVKEKKRTTMKLIVWVCLLNGIAWVWCSYILAALGKEQIAESLSQVALTEIIGVVFVYAVKSVFENLSKNNA